MSENKVKVVGADWCPDTRGALAVFALLDIKVEYHADYNGQQFVKRNIRIPEITFDDRVINEPTSAELLKALLVIGVINEQKISEDIRAHCKKADEARVKRRSK